MGFHCKPIFCLSLCPFGLLFNIIGHKELLCLWIKWPEYIPEHSLSRNVEVKSMCFCSHVDMCIYGVVPIFMQVLKLKEEFHKKKKLPL